MARVMIFFILLPLMRPQDGRLSAKAKNGRPASGVVEHLSSEFSASLHILLAFLRRHPRRKTVSSLLLNRPRNCSR